MLLRIHPVPGPLESSIFVLSFTVQDAVRSSHRLSTSLLPCVSIAFFLLFAEAVPQVEEALALMYRSLTLPITLVGRRLVGSLDMVKALHTSGKLVPRIQAAIKADKADRLAQKERAQYDFDLLVIGGGSGGLALAKVRDFSPSFFFYS